MTSKNNEQTHNNHALSKKSARECSDEIAAKVKRHDDAHTIIIAISGIQDTSHALLEKQSEILDIPNGETLFNALKTNINRSKQASSIIGTLTQTKKVMMGLKQKTQYITVLNIDAAQHSDITSLKSEIYGWAWKVLKIAQDIKNENTQNITTQNSVSHAKWDDQQTATNNMIADAFAGSYLELEGHKGALKNIAKRQVKAAFDNLSGDNAKAFPFPILLETAQMVLEDIGKSHTVKTNKFTTALNIVDEIIASMDENIILQWESFISPAQEMLWAQTSIPHILGAAIYTSDNVYNRTCAYAIAEILNTDPAPVINFEGYNAFSDIDSQQRAHKMACYETLEYIQSKQTGNQNPQAYFDMINETCKMLLDGKPNGWCAPALITMSQNIMKSPDISTEELSDIFKLEINNLSWNSIRNLHRDLNTLKNTGRLNGIPSIIELLRQEEDTRDAAITLKKFMDENA